MLSVGIIGLPNVGKSTLFNALTSGAANVSNYPFTTIDSNVGMVALPDHRLAELERLLDPKETIPAFIQFTDIAGLVPGASRGEGLGNQFLGHIRTVDAVAQVVRCFQEPDVAHVIGTVDPSRDIDVVETELLLADLEVIERIIEKRVRTWKTSPRQYAAEEKRMRDYRQKLAGGTPLRTLQLSREEQTELKGLGLLTGKPIFYVANLSETAYSEDDNSCVQRIKQSRISLSPLVVKASARFEWELLQLPPEERGEFMDLLGTRESGLDRLARTAFEILDLITFYTIANKKLRAWEVTRRTPAPQAAGKVHSDMERGFIRAQVCTFKQLAEYRSFSALHRQGLIRTEGRDYQIRDGDVVEFLFSG